MNHLIRFIVLTLFLSHLNSYAGELGSLSFSANQKFFDDENLKNVNGKSPWGAVQYQVHSGFPKIFNIEPLVGASFIKNESSTAAQKFEYQIYTGSLGLRYVPWNHNFFVLAPYLELEAQLHYARGRVVGLDGVKGKLAHGVDLAFCLGTGVFFSFLYDQQRKDDLESEWEVKDFGLFAGVHYSFSGLMEKGEIFNVLKNLNYFDFGLGLLIDW